MKKVRDAISATCSFSLLLVGFISLIFTAPLRNTHFFGSDSDDWTAHADIPVQSDGQGGNSGADCCGSTADSSAGGPGGGGAAGDSAGDSASDSSGGGPN